MVAAKYANSVDATEIMLDRQTALDKTRQEANEAPYDPATQVPLCQSEHNTWLAYWEPIWAAQACREQVAAGRSHYTLGLGIETCSTHRMRWGWRQAQRAHNYVTWCAIAADAMAEEADQYQPTEDDLFWLDYEPSDSALAMEALIDTYPRGI